MEIVTTTSNDMMDIDTASDSEESDSEIDSENENDQNNADDNGIVKNQSSFRKTSLADMQRDHNWLYYDAINEGYKCKICELFPQGVVGSQGKNRKKFSEEAVKDLTDHPKRTLTRHEQSKKHEYAVKEYEGFKSRQTIERL